MGLDLNARNLIRMRKCRRHYGVSVSQNFSSWNHSELDAYVDLFDGQKRAKNQVIWLINKGDAIFSDQPKHASIDLCRRFGRGDPTVFKTNLISSEDNIAPQRLDEVAIGISIWSSYLDYH